VFPDIRKNEILALLDQGLEDVSASRARLAWGIPFPRPTSDGVAQTVYVWFEALMNYLTATGYPDPGYEKRWPATVHFVGKDITRFHCVIWPAILESAGVALPEHVWAHGFVTMGGDKMSKSAGVKVELGDIVDRHGPDACRYYLMRDVPFNGDGEFTWERFDAVYVAEMANAFGNLVSRTVSMIERYADGIVPSSTLNPYSGDDEFDYKHYHDALGGEDGYLPHIALQHIRSTVARSNEYVDREAPWKLAKDSDPLARAHLREVLHRLAYRVALHVVHLAPFIPERAQEAWRQLGGPGEVSDQRFAVHLTPVYRGELYALDPAGWRVQKAASLFPKDAAAT
jgi:methionyl-tRNA synthetase